MIKLQNERRPVIRDAANYDRRTSPNQSDSLDLEQIQLDEADHNIQPLTTVTLIEVARGDLQDVADRCRGPTNRSGLHWSRFLVVMEVAVVAVLLGAAIVLTAVAVLVGINVSLRIGGIVLVGHRSTP
jgi:hypothetical protein